MTCADGLIRPRGRFSEKIIFRAQSFKILESGLELILVLQICRKEHGETASNRIDRGWIKCILDNNKGFRSMAPNPTSFK